VHDYGAIPFRHLAQSAEVKHILSRSGFSPKKHIVLLLREDGLEFEQDLELDIVGFDINKPEGLSNEGKVAIASESIEGVFEDIFYGVRYGIIQASDIPDDVRQMLLLDSLSNDLIEQRTKEDFDSFVVEMSEQVLLKDISDVDTLVEKAKRIKQDVRDKIISEKIHKSYDVEGLISRIGQMVMKVVNRELNINRHFEEGVSVEEALLRTTVDSLTRMSDDDIIKANNAQLSSPDYGGIDFNAGNLNLKEQGQKIGIKFINFPNIKSDTVSGITPIIINISPIINFPLLLGQNFNNPVDKLSRL